MSSIGVVMAMIELDREVVIEVAMKEVVMKEAAMEGKEEVSLKT